MKAEAAKAPPVGAAGDELARRLERGDETAYDELWCRFAAGLQGFAGARLNGDESLAEEVMVQSLAEAVRCIQHYNPDKSTLSAWIYGIARRTINLELRKQKQSKSVPRNAQVLLDMDSDLAAGEDLAASLTSRLEAKRKVQLLAECLSEAEMEVLALHYVDGFSLKEIAGIVSRSQRAVDSLLYRAKEKARERLGKHNE